MNNVINPGHFVFKYNMLVIGQKKDYIVSTRNSIVTKCSTPSKIKNFN